MLYSNCKIVKGAKRSVIADLQQNRINLIPNELYDLLNNHNGKSLDKIYEQYEKKYHEVVADYISFLVDNDFACLLDNVENFPDLDEQWHTPFEINNAIIDLDNTAHYDYKYVIAQLDDLRCKHLEIRCFFELSLDFIKGVLEYLSTTRSIITYLNISGRNSELLDQEKLKSIFAVYPRLHIVTLFGSAENSIAQPIWRNSTKLIVQLEENITDCSGCGVISNKNFIANMKSYTEAKKFNSCLNGKISVDVNGKVKNCPSMQVSYGNIQSTSLKEALAAAGFKDNWSITKDQINICKDCEFRYVCTDCRAYLENYKDDYSKPLKCGYDPYSNKWEEWSKNPLNKKAIEYYGLRKLV